MSPLRLPSRRTVGLARWVWERRPRASTVGLLLATVLGFALRMYQIGGEGLWIDEAFSVWLARQPLAQMSRWVATVDQHPPLYYTLLHVWMRLCGDTETGVRALSALFGTLTIGSIYLLGRRVAGARVGTVGAGILALSPFHVRFSQEARMYALLTWSATMAMWCFAGVLNRHGDNGPCGRRRTLPWVGCAFFTAATLWTHNAAILLPVAMNLYVVGEIVVQRLREPARSRSWSASWLRTWGLTQVAILLLWLPWAPSFLSQAAGVYRRFWLPAPTLGDVLGVLSAFLCDHLPLPLPGIIAVDVLLASLAILGLRSLRRRGTHAALLGTLVLVPLLGEWAVSYWRPILYARTLIWASIPLMLMLAAGLTQAGLTQAGPTRPGRIVLSRAVLIPLRKSQWRRWWQAWRRWRSLRRTNGCAPRDDRGGGFFRSKWRPGVMEFLALTAVLALHVTALTHYFGHFQKEQWDDAAALVAEEARPGDLLLFNASWGQIPFDYYFRQLYNRPVAEHGVPVDLFQRGVLEPEMTADDLPRLRRLTQDHRRVWLVYSHAWYTDPRGLVPSTLATYMTPLDRWEFEGLDVLLYGDRAERGRVAGAVMR